MDTCNVIRHIDSAADALAKEDFVIAQALDILACRTKRSSFTAGSPRAIQQYLICQFAQAEREVFSILWLDVKLRLIEHEIKFFGTLTHCSVYPREVVISGLRRNAAAAVLVHNHPGGNPEPSGGDQQLTMALSSALALVDIRVLDHLIVADTRIYSFAEHGNI